MTKCTTRMKNKKKITGTKFWQDDDERRRRFRDKSLGFFGTKKTPKPRMGKKEHKKNKSRCDPAKKKLDWLPLVGAGARMAVRDSYNLNKTMHSLSLDVNY